MTGLRYLILILVCILFGDVCRQFLFFCQFYKFFWGRPRNCEFVHQAQAAKRCNTLALTKGSKAKQDQVTFTLQQDGKSGEETELSKYFELRNGEPPMLLLKFNNCSTSKKRRKIIRKARRRSQRNER